jgi:hypothetical protein
MGSCRARGAPHHPPHRPRRRARHCALTHSASRTRTFARVRPSPEPALAQAAVSAPVAYLWRLIAAVDRSPPPAIHPHWQHLPVPALNHATGSRHKGTSTQAPGRAPALVRPSWPAAFAGTSFLSLGFWHAGSLLLVRCPAPARRRMVTAPFGSGRSACNHARGRFPAHGELQHAGPAHRHNAKTPKKLLYRCAAAAVITDRRVASPSCPVGQCWQQRRQQALAPTTMTLARDSRQTTLPSAIATPTAPPHHVPCCA